MSSFGRGGAVTAGMVLILVAGAAGGEALQTFSAVYGEQYRKVLATRDRADDVALAEKLLEAAKTTEGHPALVALLCEKAHELGGTDARGTAAAVGAMELLGRTVPERKASCQQKILALYQLRYRTAARQDRAGAAQALVEYLQALAAEAAAKGDYSVAVGYLRRASYVAAALGASTRQALLAKVKQLMAVERLAREEKALRDRLAASPEDTAVRERLIRLVLVERDDPVAAAKLLAADCGEPIKTCLPLAARDVGELETAACLELGEWYRSLASKASAAAKPPMLYRAKRYCEAFLARHQVKDAAHAKAVLTQKEIEGELKKLSPSTGGPIAGPAGGAGGVDHSLLLVGSPAKIEGIETWTIETSKPRASLRALAFSRDGKQIAVAGDAAVVRVLEAATGEIRRILIGHGGSIRAAAYLPDGKTLASASGDGTVRLWQAATGRLTRTVPIARGIGAAAFSRDGKRLVTAGAGGDLRLWDITGGRSLGALKGHVKDVKVAAWSADGKWIATGDAEGKVMVWSASTRMRIALIDRGLESVGAAAWSPDGKTLAFADIGAPGLFAWDRESKKVTRSIRKDVSASRVVAWSPDGRKLVCQSDGDHARVWDTKSWQPTGELGSRVLGSGPGAVWSPDGRHLAFCGRTPGHALGVGLWLCSVSGEATWNSNVARTESRTAAMSPDGRRLALTHGAFMMQVWDLTSGTLETTVADLISSHRLAWSPDGKVLAADRHNLAGVCLWDAETGSMLRECLFPGPDPKGAVGMAWSPDGKKLAAVPGWEKEPTIFDTATGKAIARLRGSRANGNEMAWSPDGKFIAMAAGGKSAVVWSAATGRFLGSVGGQGTGQEGLAWSADSRRLVCGGDDGRCAVLPLRGGRAGVLPGPKHPTRAVAWSPDGRTIVAAGPVGSGEPHASILLWDARSGRSLPPLEAHPDHIHALNWSRDGKVLMSAGRLTVRLWDFPNRRPAVTVLPTGSSTGLAFSGEGHYRLSGDVDPEKELVYVTVTAAGQETLTPSEFARRYGWANTPSKVRP